MSLGSVAERFLFFFLTPLPLPLSSQSLHSLSPTVVFRNRYLLETPQQ